MDRRPTLWRKQPPATTPGEYDSPQDGMGISFPASVSASVLRASGVHLPTAIPLDSDTRSQYLTRCDSVTCDGAMCFHAPPVPTGRAFNCAQYCAGRCAVWLRERHDLLGEPPAQISLGGGSLTLVDAEFPALVFARLPTPLFNYDPSRGDVLGVDGLPARGDFRTSAMLLPDGSVFDGSSLGRSTSLRQACSLLARSVYRTPAYSFTASEVLPFVDALDPGHLAAFLRGVTEVASGGDDTSGEWGLDPGASLVVGQDHVFDFGPGRLPRRVTVRAETTSVGSGRWRVSLGGLPGHSAEYRVGQVDGDSSLRGVAGRFFSRFPELTAARRAIGPVRMAGNGMLWNPPNTCVPQ